VCATTPGCPNTPSCSKTSGEMCCNVCPATTDTPSRSQTSRVCARTMPGRHATTSTPLARKRVGGCATASGRYAVTDPSSLTNAWGARNNAPPPTACPQHTTADPSSLCKRMGCAQQHPPPTACPDTPPPPIGPPPPRSQAHVGMFDSVRSPRRHRPIHACKRVGCAQQRRATHCLSRHAATTNRTTPSLSSAWGDVL
jgi:hypothetical protein